jgi:predicted ester cyclase
MKINRRQALTVASVAAITTALDARSMGSTETNEIEHTKPATTNAEIIRRQNDVLNRGDIAAAVQLYAEDANNNGRAIGRQGLLAVLTDIYTTFPDWHMEIEDLDAVGDDVIVRGNVMGTHKGVGQRPVNGGLLVGVAPTGKSFKVQHIHWFTLKNGLIVQHRATRDDLGMMQQLGLLPAVKRDTSATPNK